MYLTILGLALFPWPPFQPNPDPSVCPAVSKFGPFPFPLRFLPLPFPSLPNVNPPQSPHITTSPPSPTASTFCALPYNTFLYDQSDFFHEASLSLHFTRLIIHFLRPRVHSFAHSLSNGPLPASTKLQVILLSLDHHFSTKVVSDEPLFPLKKINTLS